jgi:hypothetical protein
MREEGGQGEGRVGRPDGAPPAAHGLLIGKRDVAPPAVIGARYAGTDPLVGPGLRPGPESGDGFAVTVLCGGAPALIVEIANVNISEGRHLFLRLEYRAFHTMYGFTESVTIKAISR